MNKLRLRKLVEKAIKTFSLDLSGLVVLTEAATGYYALTPIIAASASANRVLAITRDSRFGRAMDAQDTVLSLADEWDIKDKIDILLSRDDDRVGQADIVTNLGFVRPLDASLLRRLKRTAVIPLMWETWEHRPDDLDLGECRRLGIPVLGTNEHYPDLRTFEYIGLIALKALFIMEIEVFLSNVVVVGSGEFAKQTLDALRKAGAEVTLLVPGNEEMLKSQQALLALREADAVVIVEHQDRKELIGRCAQIGADELFKLNSNLVVVHICGGVDRSALTEAGLRCFPDTFAPAGHMSLMTSFLGPKPLIDLHTGGLKVGERMARLRANGLPALEVETQVLQEASLAQGFV